MVVMIVVAQQTASAVVGEAGRGKGEFNSLAGLLEKTLKRRLQYLNGLGCQSKRRLSERWNEAAFSYLTGITRNK